MTNFIRNILIFIIVPTIVLLFIIVPYFIKDPYLDYGKKENYSWTYFFQQLGDISTKKLINSTQEYNSFVFGSSRTTGIYACYLNQSIPNSSFYHYGNWNETIGGIYNKLQLIDSLGYKIENVLIYLDTDYTFKGEGKSHISDHYLISKQSKFNYLKTHFTSFYSNLTLKKLKILYGFKIDGTDFPNWHSDLKTNDPNHNCNDPKTILNYSLYDDSEILSAKIDSLKSSNILFNRQLHEEYLEEQISDSEKSMLIKIRELLKKHSTNYYFVITPLYDQKKFNISDQIKLVELFGDRVFDFSGINEYTANEYNYPDGKHFQPYISKCIIDSIIKVGTYNFSNK
ncbi:hypothetical protein DNU06_11715 [Putridiphycobacter roseus]|uniref:Uncharacterized protein n=1 Tax=Putridiphycobacter roseus TaxID=2219161 RepID=A0A2W1MWM1_9FLAO|nr:hypothetical protein [Putridiphycobacter roseus]PZE16519.1 hypothetical protein DNU06_11715 [Putridiphycobacter roseus]